MASLTIRNLDDSVKRRLRIRAAQHGRSMEEEARSILRGALDEREETANLADLAAALFGRNGIDMPEAPSIPVRPAPIFDE